MILLRDMEIIQDIQRLLCVAIMINRCDVMVRMESRCLLVLRGVLSSI